MTRSFETIVLADALTVTAPDGSQVDILAKCGAGSMARFSLQMAGVSKAVRHRSVEELWFIIAGRGEMWRSTPTGVDEITALAPGVSLAIAPGTSFQFRCLGPGPLEAIGVTMPPWPGMDEAELVNGKW